MTNPSPNFLTCPAAPELPPPEEGRSVQPTEYDRAWDQEEQVGNQPAVVPPSNSKKKKKLLKVFLFVCVLGFIAASVSFGIVAFRVGTAAYTAKHALTDSKDKIQRGDVEGAKADLELANRSFTQARDALQSAGVWRDLPGLGTQMRALEDALAAGSETVQGGQDLLQVYGIIVDALRGGMTVSEQVSTGIAPTRKFSDLSADEKRELLRKFADALPTIRLARDKIDLAVELWNRVPQDRLSSPLRAVLKPLADSLPVLKRTMDESVPLIETLVPLAGYPKPIRYLAVLQNADELRPAGGFIGSVGTVAMDAGDLKEFSFTDIYNIDNPASYAWKEVPPAPIAQRLGVHAWFLRDANWSPDFPMSADRLLDFYTRERAIASGRPLADPPNAVLAIEPGFVKAIFQLTGSVTIDGQTYTAENFFDKLEYQVEQGFLQQGVPLERRKELIQKIGQALVERLSALPASRWPEILDVVTQSLAEKRLMVYSKDAQTLALLDTRGWTGRTKPTQGDFVWVVDANLAALKTDGVMKKTILYSLDATDPTKPIGTVTLSYTNTATAITWRYTRYRSYTRVYVPEGSTLLSSSGAMKDDVYKTGGHVVAGQVDVTKELGKTVFGAFWSIEPGQTSTLRFTYALPSSVTESMQLGTYHLDWSKQAGADSTQLTLSLLFGKTIGSASPPEDQAKWGDAKYEVQTDSLEDRSFDVKLVE